MILVAFGAGRTIQPRPAKLRSWRGCPCGWPHDSDNCPRCGRTYRQQIGLDSVELVPMVVTGREVVAFLKELSGPR